MKGLEILITIHRCKCIFAVVVVVWAMGNNCMSVNVYKMFISTYTNLFSNLKEF